MWSGNHGSNAVDGAFFPTSDWPMFGENPGNTASPPETAISVATAPSLKPKWTFTTGGDVSARAAISKRSRLFPGLGWKYLGGKCAD